MCLRDALCDLRNRGIEITESQLRWAIKTGKVSRPRVDGSLRFDFSPENLADLANHFSPPQVAANAS